MSFTGDTARYFPDSLVDRLLRDTAKPPVVRGELSFTSDDFKPRWLAMPDGRFQLWFQPGLGKYAPPDLYVVSADIGMGLGGSGGSNSALTVLNRRTLRKVASFVIKIRCSEYAFASTSSSVMPRASSYTENTSCALARSQFATLGPVHSSTRNRIQADSAMSGMNSVWANARDANSRHA